jgi:hypothetical protein
MEQNTALTVAVILVAIAVLMQAGSMLGIWLTLRKIPGQIESVRADVKQRLDPLTQSALEIVNNSREPLRNITANLSEISTMLRDRTSNVDAVAAELLEKSRQQIIRVDKMVSDLVEKVETSAACSAPSRKSPRSSRECGPAWSSFSRAAVSPT